VPREFERSKHRAGNDPPMLRQITHAINDEQALRLIGRGLAFRQKTLQKPL